MRISPSDFHLLQIQQVLAILGSPSLRVKPAEFLKVTAEFDSSTKRREKDCIKHLEKKSNHRERNKTTDVLHLTSLASLTFITRSQIVVSLSLFPFALV